MSGGATLVTGGHGFVGSHLARALLRGGETVRALDRPAPRAADVGGERASGLELLGIAAEVEQVEADLRDADAVAAAVAGTDSVFHLAAQTIVGVARESPLRTMEVNVRGAWNVFEACRGHGVSRVVFASSDKAYGASAELPYREDFPLRGSFPYDASKAAADIVARSYAAEGLPLAVTRFANVYGGGDLNFSRLIPETVVATLDGRPPQIRSDGSPERDFLYVDDAVAAYLAIAGELGDGGRAAGEAFNAGGGRPHPVREVVEAIAELAGTGVEPEFLGAGSPHGEIDRQYVDSSKLREATGWEPRTGLRDGLALTLDWYRENPEARPPVV